MATSASRSRALRRNSRSNLGLKNTGALLREVTPGKPGEKAGLKQGDVITGSTAKPVKDSNDLTIKVINTRRAPPSHLDVIRNGNR